MGEHGQRLLDDSDWIVQSTALLATDDSEALSSVSFGLSPELRDRAASLSGLGDDISSGLEALLVEAVDLDVEIDRDSVFVLGPDSWAGSDSDFRRIVARFSETSQLRIEDYDLADVLEELQIPVFESQSKSNKALKDWGPWAGEVIIGIGHVAPYVLHGHAAAVLVVVAPPIGGAVIVGSALGLGGVTIAGYLKKRSREKKARKAVEEQARRDAAAADQEARERAERETEAAREEKVRRQHEVAEEKQKFLKKKIPPARILKPKPKSP